MDKKWFVYYQENVMGPFTTKDIYRNCFEDERDILLWSKGQREWLTLEDWKQSYDQTQKNKKQSLWYAENRGKQFGPYTKDQLIQFLSYYKDLSQVHLWTEGQEQWVRLFEFSDITEAIGITRRKYVRAPIVGRVSITRGAKIFYKDIFNISTQGIGVKNVFELKVGDLVTLKIQSLLIVEPLKVQATVKYINPSGLAGMHFSEVSEKSKAYLNEYIKQFG